MCSTPTTSSHHWDSYRVWSVQYLVKDPGCHLTLAHWWVYLRDPNRFMSQTQTGSCPLWFSSCAGDGVQNPQECFYIDLWLTQQTCMIETLTLNQQVHTSMNQIQETASHEDIAFHENAMGPMYQISIVFSLTWEATIIVTSVVYDRLLYFRA